MKDDTANQETRLSYHGWSRLNPGERPYYFIGLAIVLIFVFTITIFVANGSIDNASNLGPLGDFFGGLLNPFFALASFAALLYTIKLQSDTIKIQTKEMELSRKQLVISNEELALTRNELADSATAQKEQALLMSMESRRSDLFKTIDALSNKIEANRNDNSFKNFVSSDYPNNLRGLSKSTGLWSNTMPYIARGLTSLPQTNNSRKIQIILSEIYHDLDILVVCLEEYDETFIKLDSRSSLSLFYEGELKSLVHYLSRFSEVHKKYAGVDNPVKLFLSPATHSFFETKKELILV